MGSIPVRRTKFNDFLYRNDRAIFLHNDVVSLKEKTMKWTAPVAQDMRFGFEITMYIANR